MGKNLETGGAVAATLVVAASDSVDPTRADSQSSGVADEVEINAALVAAAGGRVILLEGTYNCAANIVVPADTKLEGQGWGTILNFDDGGAGTVTNAGAITINGHDVHVFNLKVLIAAGCGSAGTRPNGVTANGMDNTLLENLWIYGDQTINDNNDGRQNGIYLASTERSLVFACRCQHNQRHGVSCLNPRRVTISNCTCIDNAWRGIHLSTGFNNVVTGNHCMDNINDGIYLDSPNYTTVTANSCDGNVTHGIHLHSLTGAAIVGNICEGNFGDGIFVYDTLDSLIDSNECYDNSFYGLEMDFNCSRISITGNTFSRNDRHGIYSRRSVTDCVISGNICDRNDFEGNTYSGINLDAGSRCTISANICNQNGLHNIALVANTFSCPVTGNSCFDSFTGDGIYIAGNYHEVTGNSLWNNQGYGINIASGSAIRVINNRYITNVTGQFLDGGTDTQLATYVVSFVDGTDPQDSGYLIDAGGELARAYLRLPPEVQQVVRMVVYARAKTVEVHEMELEMVVKGAADNEPYATHDGSIAALDSISVNFAADDVIFWRNIEAGVLALLGGDSVEVKVLHAPVSGDNLDTQAYFRTVEIQYV
ncbi:hypothetical protein LCGC14_1303460 [marine sediment metagenome]|uniref:Uncharacterized protein n=1 Tax=marine sediment metagenome TaxID=412755 RepID=A0A0F9L9H8_9ZZZZ